MALGIGRAILAAGVVVLVVRNVPRWKQEREDPLSWRLTHFSPAALTALLAAVGAVATMTTSLGGLYWLAGGDGGNDGIRAHQQLGSARRDQALAGGA